MASTHALDIGTLLPRPPRSPLELPLADAVFAVVDLETTGFSNDDRIIDIAVSRVDVSGAVLSEYTARVNPGRDVGPTHIHGITNADVRHAPRFADIADEVTAQLADAVVVAHSAPFESRFLGNEYERLGGIVRRLPALCTLKLARAARLAGDDKTLAACCAQFGITVHGAHTAIGDVRATRQLLVALLSRHLDTYGDLTAALGAAHHLSWAPATTPASRPRAAEPATGPDEPAARRRASGAFGDRTPRSWATEYTRCGGTHPDSRTAALTAPERNALSNVCVATHGERRPATATATWLAHAVDDVLQRGDLPPVPRASADAAGLSPTRDAAALASLPHRSDVDSAIDMHPTYEQPFWEQLNAQHPELGRWTTPQASLDGLLDDSGADRFVDFLIAAPWAQPLAVELDGPQHQAARDEDRRRDADLAGAGVRVHRSPGAQVADHGSALWTAIADVARSSAPGGQGEAVRDLLGPGQLHRFAFAVSTAVRNGWLTPGGHWRIAVTDDLDVVDEAAAVPLFELMAAISELWALDVAPATFSLGNATYTRTGTVYLRSGTRPATAADVAVILEATVPAHAPLPEHPEIPAVLIRPSLPAGRHPWRTARRDRRPLNESAQAVKATLEVLCHTLFGYATLRDEQTAALHRCLSGADLVVVLPTGYGKSLVYQLAGTLLGGTTIIVDPINALIDDQVRRFHDAGVSRALGISSSRQRDVSERRAALDATAAGDATFVLCSPERFGTAAFRETIAALAAGNGVGLCVIDEAHCVSEWGHDFRTSYLRLADTLRRHATPARTATVPPLLAMTGTASPAVLRDVLRELGIDADTPDTVLRPTKFDRANLHYSIDISARPRADRLADALTGVIPDTLNLTAEQLFDGTGRHAGIVFVPHTNGEHGLHRVAGDVTEALARHGLTARIGLYSGAPPKGTSTDAWDRAKVATAAAFGRNELDILIATKAFGMGVDKANVRWTVHTNIPASIESFAQEAGRAGRIATEAAACHLMGTVAHGGRTSRLITGSAASAPRGRHDLDLQLFFHDRSFPGRDTEVNVALELYSTLVEASAATGVARIAAGDDELRQRALHRLAVLGIVDDYTVEYGSGVYRVKVRHPNPDELDRRYLTWANRIEPGRTNARRKSLNAAPVAPDERALHHITAVVDTVYTVIEPARKHALREMYDLAATAVGDDEIRGRIAAYLHDGPLAAALRSIAAAENLNLVAAIRSLDLVAASGAHEWIGAASRQLEGAATNPVLLAARGLGEALLVDGDRDTFRAFMSDAFTNLPRYGITDNAGSALLGWLLVQLRNRDNGRRWAWTADLWALWSIAGRRADTPAPIHRRVLSEAAAGNVHHDELGAVLAARLAAAADLVDAPGGRHPVHAGR